jgi:hypothetical protein
MLDPIDYSEFGMAEKLLFGWFMSPCMTSPGFGRMVAVAVPGTTPASLACEREVFENIVRIVRAEFLEMPEMRLTRMQFRRLWHLGEAECERVIAHLLGSGFLWEGGQGWIGRPHDR